MDSSTRAGAERRRLYDGLVDNDWLLGSQTTKAPGLGPAALAVYDGLARLIAHTTRERFHQTIVPVRFPPVFESRMLERTDYVASFPQLMGTVDSFLGDAKQFRSLLSVYDDGGDWQSYLDPTGLALTSSACHPLYAWLEGRDADPTRLYELTGDCFRHEPSTDPMRLIAFRMREYVRVGTEQQAKDHRDRSLDVARAVYEAVDLEVEVVPANDPFFGRGGVILAANQREAQAKFELVAEVYPGTQTAIGSANYHDTHFGGEFSITSPDGSTAHSACLGFGMERTVFALAARHGYDLDAWPSSVRHVLAL